MSEPENLVERNWRDIGLLVEDGWTKMDHETKTHLKDFERKHTGAQKSPEYIGLKIHETIFEQV